MRSSMEPITWLGLALLLSLVISGILIFLTIIISTSLVGFLLYFKVNPGISNTYINNESSSELENILSQELQNEGQEDDDINEDDDGNHPYYNDHINPSDN